MTYAQLLAEGQDIIQIISSVLSKGGFLSDLDLNVSRLVFHYIVFSFLFLQSYILYVPFILDVIFQLNVQPHPIKMLDQAADTHNLKQTPKRKHSNNPNNKHCTKNLFS